MNEGVPFFAALMAMTTHKMGKINLESVGKLEPLESFKKSGKVVPSPKGNGALKI
jgi:hypothetical protein